MQLNTFFIIKNKGIMKCIFSLLYSGLLMIILLNMKFINIILIFFELEMSAHLISRCKRKKLCKH